MKKIGCYVSIFMLQLVLLLTVAFPVYAAGGKLAISVSSGTVDIGNTVTVKLWAKSDTGEKAAADMIFKYNPAVFSVESCDNGGYADGSGTVTVRASEAKIILRAIDAGTSNLVVDGSNAVTVDTGETLSGVVSAGTSISAGAGDTSQSQTEPEEPTQEEETDSCALKNLSFSAGELDQAFSGAVKEYILTVPYEVESLEVNAQPAFETTKVKEITGTEGFQVGENTLTITLEAEDGTTGTYTILVLRQTERVDKPADEVNTDEQSQENLRKDLQELKEKYEKQKSSSRKIIAVLVFVIVVLVIFCFNILVLQKNNTPAARKKKIKSNKPQPKREEKEVEEEWLDTEIPEKVSKDRGNSDVIDFDDL